MPLTFAELKKREGATPVAKPEHLERKGLVRRAGEFLAPTTTGLITGEKEVTLPRVLGAALEVGSFAIPTGAIARGVGLLGRAGVTAARGAATVARGARAVSGAAKVAKVAKEAVPLTFDSLANRAGAIGKQIGRQAKIASAVGGVSGGMFGAGRVLGEDRPTIQGVAGGAALGAAGGAIGGAVLAPTISFATAGARAGTRLLSKAIRGTTKRLRPQTAKTATDNLSEAYLNSFVEDKTGVNTALDKALIQSRRGRGVVPQTKEALVRELAEGGYVPKVEGELANMRGVLDELANERGKLANRLDDFLKPRKAKVSIGELQSRTIREIQDDFSVEDITKSLSKIDQVFNVLKRKHGKSMTAFDINQLRKEMNQATAAFKGMTFNDDAFNAIGRITRQVLEERVPAPVVRGINDEITRLFRLSRVAEIFNNKKIDPGILAESLGRFMGTVGAAAGGFAIAGPGGLVIAGLAAQLGSKVLARIVRNTRFNPQVIAVIRQAVNRDTMLLQKLLKEAENKADRALLEKVFRER